MSWHKQFLSKFIHFNQFTFAYGSNKLKSFYVYQIVQKMEQPNASEMENSKQEESKSQSSKLRAFEKIKRNLATAGFTPSLSDQPCLLNKTILSGFLMMLAVIYCTCEFIIHDAKTFSEYTQSVFTCSLATLIFLVLIIFVVKVKKLFGFITVVDEMINTSEFYNAMLCIISQMETFCSKSYSV